MNKIKSLFKMFKRSRIAVIVAGLAVAGVASAAVLTYYATINGETTVEQAVLVDGKNYNQPITGEWDENTKAGSTTLKLHTLENNAEVPATIGFSTEYWYGGHHNFSSNPEPGITTSYMNWATPEKVLTGERPTAVYNNTGSKEYEVWYKTSATNLHYAYYHDQRWDGDDTNVSSENDCPFVMKENGVYYMINLANGDDQNFYIYTSSNGKHWTNEGKVFTKPTGDWNKIDNPKLLKTSTGYNMYFQAKSTTVYPGDISSNPNYYYILLATTTKTSLSAIADGSDDLDFANSRTVLSPGTSGTWDDFKLMHPMVIKEGNQYIMMYVGYSDTDKTQKIGYAVSSDGIAWVSIPVSTQGYDTTLGEGSSKPSLVNENGNVVLFYQDGANINKTTLVPLASTNMTLQPQEIKPFFIKNDFAINLVPGDYKIKTSVNPAN